MVNTQTEYIFITRIDEEGKEYNSNYFVHLEVCDDCGSVVFNRFIHQQFHWDIEGVE